MKMTYASPELVQFGSIEALTASSIKCTPAGDEALASAHLHGHFFAEFDENGEGVEGTEFFVPELHDGEGAGSTSPQCSNLGSLL